MPGFDDGLDRSGRLWRVRICLHRSAGFVYPPAPEQTEIQYTWFVRQPDIAALNAQRENLGFGGKPRDRYRHKLEPADGRPRYDLSFLIPYQQLERRMIDAGARLYLQA